MCMRHGLVRTYLCLPHVDARTKLGMLRNEDDDSRLLLVAPVLGSVALLTRISPGPVRLLLGAQGIPEVAMMVARSGALGPVAWIEADAAAIEC